MECQTGLRRPPLAYVHTSFGVDLMPHTIEPLYEALLDRVTKAARDLKSDEMTDKLVALIVASRGFLMTLSRVPLISKVANKSYFMFSDPARSKTSRPVNLNLFDDSLTEKQIRSLLNCEVDGLTENSITASVYSCAIAYCCAVDIIKVGDKKTPGTFFEIIIGHIVARSLGVNPETTITVPTLDVTVTLPTDYVFDLGPNKNRVHLPIKTSTRERVVQVWAHQRVLDGMHGVSRFKGVLVALAETNKQKNVSVSEVCLPDQWKAYQMYIAQMFRVYYLDTPEKYLSLKYTYPFIQVKPFGAFFAEVGLIEKPGVGG
jgi:hypothetical protein